MAEFIDWFAEFAVSILAMIGAITVFIVWGHFADKKYEESDAATKKKISERRGIIAGVVILLIILAVITASISSIFF